MTTNQKITKGLCVYQDEAAGANAIPLVVLGKDLRVKMSSDYFMNGGIVIDLQLSERNEILKIQLGPDICIELQTMKEGLEVGPLGLFPVHVLQLDPDFNAKDGGRLHFGFLKKIFVKKSLTFALKRTLSKWTGLEFNKAFRQEKNLLAACANHYGESNWGTFDIVFRKKPSGAWAIYKDLTADGEDTIEKIVARFNVNRAGVALGIEEMYCE